MNKIKATPISNSQSLLSFFCFYLLDSLVGFSLLVGQAPPKELPRLHHRSPPCESIVDCSPYIPNQDEVEALAKMLYGEARGIPSDMEKSRLCGAFSTGSTTLVFQIRF